MGIRFIMRRLNSMGSCTQHGLPFGYIVIFCPYIDFKVRIESRNANISDFCFLSSTMIVEMPAVKLWSQKVPFSYCTST